MAEKPNGIAFLFSVLLFPELMSKTKEEMIEYIDAIKNSGKITEEEYQKFEEEHKGQKEYKITCLSEEAKQSLDEEYPDKKLITEGGTNYDTEKKLDRFRERT